VNRPPAGQAAATRRSASGAGFCGWPAGGGWLQAYGVAEGFELCDQAAGFPVGVQAGGEVAVEHSSPYPSWTAAYRRSNPAAAPPVRTRIRRTASASSPRGRCSWPSARPPSRTRPWAISSRSSSDRSSGGPRPRSRGSSTLRPRSARRPARRLSSRIPGELKAPGSSHRTAEAAPRAQPGSTARYRTPRIPCAAVPPARCMRLEPPWHPAPRERLWRASVRRQAEPLLMLRP
jgi:hypothetical protein